MKILSVKINNILSIEDAYVEFGSDGLVLVCGWDHDSGRANGAGKTALFNAITFALYDKIPRKVTATEILRRGSKSGSAEVSVQVGDDRYIVKRSRPKGVSFLKNGEQVVLTQEEWENVLKINYTQYLISAYCAQGSSLRFLSTNDSDKKEFMLQLLNLEEFSSCKNTADVKAKSLQEQVNTLNTQIDSASSKIDAYGESLVDENVIKYAIGESQKAVYELTLELVKTQAVLRPDLSKYQKLEDDIAIKKVDMTKVKTRREILHDQYRRVKAKIGAFNMPDVCASCGTSLDISAAKHAHSKEVSLRTDELAAIKSQIDECDASLSKEKDINELLSKVRDKKKVESADYESASMRALEIGGKIELRQQEVKTLNLKLENNAELINKIKILSDSHAKYVNTRANILRDIELYKTISSMCSPTGAQAYILDSVIESFNEMVSDYTKILWSNLTYELQSYKENVKGDVSAKFSESLTMNGKLVSIGSLSGGEFRALSLCVDFALIGVMERQFGISLSPIILDEPWDGLDASGKELIMELLSVISNDKMIVVVDHSSEVAATFSKVIKVEKRNGISSIIKSEDM